MARGKRDPRNYRRSSYKPSTTYQNENTWKMQDGTKIAFTDMSERHLESCVNLLKRRKLTDMITQDIDERRTNYFDRIIAAMEKEIEKRQAQFNEQEGKTLQTMFGFN